ncbi:MAG: hypothetical protein K2P78_10860 [Gemmataceae bacterium]|nr:hypothetical protein [Gemmataceae bacterium]
MTQTIDVTGLSPEAVRVVEEVVGLLRGRPAAATPPPYWPGPPQGETAEEWVTRFRTWAASHPKRDIVIDDDRDSIYDRSCE